MAAAGPFIGRAQSWRHLLAAGPFGPDGEVEIAAMRTPHVGPQVEFYKIDPDSGGLDPAATRPGYPSHIIYSRNFDEFVAIRHTRDGVEPVWSLPLVGTLTTNLASATNSRGRAQVAAGRTDRVLRIWP